MKYRLKKDLPFAKAGEKIEFLISDGQTYGYDLTALCVRFWIKHETDKQILIEGGWIEEVKPREWVILFRSGGLAPVVEDYHTKNQLPNISEYYTEIIKVREVLE